MVSMTGTEFVLALVGSIVVAILGSSVLTVLVSKWFDRFKTAATVDHIEAETTDILTQAWERSMKHLTTQIEMQQERIFELEKKLDSASERIASLVAEVHILEEKLSKYEREHP